MTPAERDIANKRRALIAAQNRAANPRRANRVIEPGSLEDDLNALLGRKKDTPGDIDWRALTRDG